MGRGGLDGAADPLSSVVIEAIPESVCDLKQLLVDQNASLAVCFNIEGLPYRREFGADVRVGDGKVARAVGTSLAFDSTISSKAPWVPLMSV